MTMTRALTLAIALGAAAACAPVQGADAGRGDFSPVYQGIETVLLEDDLVNFRVAMQGARGRSDVDDYARCAAAQYACGCGLHRVAVAAARRADDRCRGRGQGLRRAGNTDGIGNG
jgi:hypothetical protein